MICTVEMEEGLVTMEGTIAFPDRRFDFKNTFEVRADGVLVDRWYQNAFGGWRPGHVIEYSREIG
jgi:hypothetical protein